MLKAYKEELISEGHIREDEAYKIEDVITYAALRNVEYDMAHEKEPDSDYLENISSIVHEELGRGGPPKMFTFPNHSMVHINSNVGIDKHYRHNAITKDEGKVVPLRVDASTQYEGIPKDTTMLFYTSAMREGVSIYHPFKYNIVDARVNLLSDPTGIDHALQAFARLRNPRVPRYLIIKREHGRVRKLPSLKEVKDMAEHIANNSADLHHLDMYQSLFKDVAKAIDMSETIKGWQVSPSIVIGIYLRIKALNETVLETAKLALEERGIPYREVSLADFMLEKIAVGAPKEEQKGETYAEVRDNAKAAPTIHKKLLKIIDNIEANGLDFTYADKGLLKALTDPILLQSMRIGATSYKEFQEARSLDLSGVYSLVGISRVLNTVLDVEGKRLFKIRGNTSTTKVCDIKKYLEKIGCKSEYVDSQGKQLKVLKGAKGVRIGFASETETFEGKIENREYYPIQGSIKIRDPVSELNKYLPTDEQVTIIL